MLFEQIGGDIPADLADGAKQPAIFDQLLVVNIFGDIIGMTRGPHFQTGMQFTRSKGGPLGAFTDGHNLNRVVKLFF